MNLSSISCYPAFTAILLALFAIWYRQNSIHFYRAIITETVDDEYDFIVIGGGSAGSVVAARLAEEDTSRILLLEAGGFFDERGSFHVPIRWTESIHSEYDWGYYSEPQSNAHFGMKDGKAYLPRGRVLGGTGLLNAAVYVRGSPSDFDLWEESSCKGWGYQDVLPYFLKSEDIQIEELKSSRYHGSGGPLTVSYGSSTPLTDAFLKAGQELGYNVTDYNGAGITGFSKAQYNVRNGVRSSTSLAYLGGTKRDNLDISIHSFVTKLEIQNKRAVGVYFIKNGLKRYVKARKEIVVSAGAINSPKLLMLSGIGPEDHLESIGIPVVADIPVGATFLDHAGVVVHSTINKPYGYTMDVITSWWSELQYLIGKGPKAATGVDSTAFLHFNTLVKHKNKPDVQFEFLNILFGNHLLNLKDKIAKEFLISDPMNTHGFTMLLSPVRPKSSGSLQLRSSDPFDDPKINLNFLSDENDLRNLVNAIRVWEKLMETKSMQELGVDIAQMKMSFCSDHEFRSDAYWECFIRHLLIPMFHHSGTCKMGPGNDPTAVVDLDLRVKEILSLRVADASIFPIITSGNSHAPTIMVAEKAADLMRKSNQ